MNDPEEVDYDEGIGQGEYDSGPFCRHGSDPCDCDVLCETCGHECCQQEQINPGECCADYCTCEEFK